MTQGRIWHALQPNWSMLTILVHCSFTPLLWPPCTRLIYVSTLRVFIRPQWSVVYPPRFYNFTMQVNLACPLGTLPQNKCWPNNSLFWIKCWFLTNFNIQIYFCDFKYYNISFCWFSEIFLAVGVWYMVNNYNELINVYLLESLSCTFDLITVKQIVKLLITALQVPLCCF